jgi:hypothetical protein
MGEGGGAAGEREINGDLRDRLEARYRSLMKAYDSASHDPTDRAIEDLRQATDELMRAAAALQLVLSGARAGATRRRPGS